MSESYKIHEFARLAGVTVKALHHYDRLGLLKPARTTSGYRVYIERDLERLEQIIALKFLGVPLKQIKSVLDRAEVALPGALRLQRRALEEKQMLLGRAIRAARGEDPACEKAQALADRYIQLAIRAQNGDPDLQMDSGAAWMDREHWPHAMKRRIAEFGLEDVRNFITDAAIASRKKYFSEEAWANLKIMNLGVTWQNRVDLFSDIESALDEDPAGGKGRELAARWSAYLDDVSDNDPAIKAGLLNTWADRRNWTASLRYREEGLSRMTGDQFDRVADFIDNACTCATKLQL